MRAILTVLLLLLPLAVSCVEEPEPTPSGPPLCDDCDNAESCPPDQPNLNPLEPCDEVDATCYYCGPVMRRHVCRADEDDGELWWRDAGEVDMCPPPPEPMTSDGTN